MQGAFSQFTHSSVANYMAQYSLYGELLQQSTLWGFIEAFRIVGMSSIVLIPLIFIIKKIGK